MRKKRMRWRCGSIELEIREVGLKSWGKMVGREAWSCASNKLPVMSDNLHLGAWKVWSR